MRHLITLLSIFTFLTSSTLHAQPPSYVPTDGLVGWWPFNGNANDESGNGNNGTAQNGADLTIDRFGQPLSAFTFDGVDDFINISDNITLELLNTAFTINAWIQPASLIGGQIIYKGQSFGNNQPKYIYQWNNGIYAYHTNGPGQNTGTWFYSIPSSITEWVMATVVRSGENIYFYQGGNLIASLPYIPSIVSTTGFDLRIGGPEPNGGNGWTGKIDDVCIWNRALSQTEILSLFNAPPPPPCISPDPVSYSGLSTSYTTIDAPATLSATPAGGVFIGPGVMGSTFSPAVAGEGTHSISYTYLDGDNCVNTASLCTSVSLGMGLEPGGNAPGGVRVFPNPNRGQFTVELELAGLVGLQVFDARGALVHSEVFTASGSRTQRTLDLSAFAKGSYTLLVEHDGQRVSQTVVVE